MGSSANGSGQAIAMPKGGGALHGIGEKFSEPVSDVGSDLRRGCRDRPKLALIGRTRERLHDLASQLENMQLRRFAPRCVDQRHVNMLDSRQTSWPYASRDGSVSV
jgi:hypothetical protein